MGAFDTYSSRVHCPSCNDLHWNEGQTKFFVPDFLRLHMRWFQPGIPQELDFEPADLHRARVWDHQWLRIREPGDPSRLAVLGDDDEFFLCTCRTPLMTVLRFSLEPRPDGTGTATLLEASLHDVSRDPRLVDVDFADAEPLVPWTGDFEAFKVGLAWFAGLPAEMRAERLRAHLREAFLPVPEVEDGLSGWTAIQAAMRCEACGAERERSVHTAFSGRPANCTLLGPGWPGGVLRIGTRVAGDFAWLDDDVDLTPYMRLRHPIPQDRVTLLGHMRGWGCPCGAGRASLVYRFARDGGGITLAGVSLRVVRGARDLADIDFADFFAGCRDDVHRAAGGRYGSREKAVGALLTSREWRMSADEQPG